jgi:hypothetical protein
MDVSKNGLYRIGHRYSDPSGKGVFFLNKSGSVSWGRDADNVQLTLVEAQAEAPKHNRPNTDDNWEVWPDVV